TAEFPDGVRSPEWAVRSLEHWVRTAGVTIYYNAAVYLEGGCPGEVVMVGNYGGAGWEYGTPAECRRDGWIAIDLEPLLRARRVLYDRTYCFDVRAADGRRGAHAARGAPGYEAVRVPGPRSEGRALGFRVERRTLFGDRVVLTNQGYQWLAC